jgi:hypothetical protein
MSEQVPNTECRICGHIYYSCRKCGELNHWKSVACSPEHYSEYVTKVLEERSKFNKVDSDKIIDKPTEKVVIKKTSRVKISENAQ